MLPLDMHIDLSIIQRMASQKYTLTINFEDLMGEPPTGYVAYIYARRTDTTDPQAGIYTDDTVFNKDIPLRIEPGPTGAVSIDLIPSAAFHVRMEYVLRIGRSDLPFSMPGRNANLLNLITGGEAPPVQPVDTNYYLAAAPTNSVTGADLATLLTGGTTSTSRSPIASPTFTGNNYLYFAQPSSVADITSAVAVPGSRNQIRFWRKQNNQVTINTTQYNVWITATVVFDSASGRQYRFS